MTEIFDPEEEFEIYLTGRAKNGLIRTFSAKGLKADIAYIIESGAVDDTSVPNAIISAPDKITGIRLSMDVVRGEDGRYGKIRDSDWRG